MARLDWARRLVAILAVALLAAVGAAALPDNPYQRWQLIEHTLYANATWSYERIHFDPAPIDVAIIGSSRSQIGLSAPRIAARLAALGHPATVANLSVIEDGRNIEWAIADELFRFKQPKLLIVLINEEANKWGHPGFKYVAPAAAVAWPPAPFLHNSLYDISYLPFRQMRLFAASLFPAASGLRSRFDPEHYAALPTDYTTTQVMADGVRIDMEQVHSAQDLRDEMAAFAATQRPSRMPKLLTPITDADNLVYVDKIAKLAQAHHAPIMFVYLPHFEGPRVIQGRDLYARLGRIEDYGDLAGNPTLFQSFAHFNHHGAMIASDRIAAAVAPLISTDPALAAAPAGGYAASGGGR